MKKYNTIHTKHFYTRPAPILNLCSTITSDCLKFILPSNIILYVLSKIKNGNAVRGTIFSEARQSWFCNILLKAPALINEDELEQQ